MVLHSSKVDCQTSLTCGILLNPISAEACRTREANLTQNATFITFILPSHQSSVLFTFCKWVKIALISLHWFLCCCLLAGLLCNNSFT